MIVRHSSGQYSIDFGPVAIPEGIIITDANVAAARPDLIKDRQAIILEPGEQTKSLESYGDLCRELVRQRASRKTNLIALGGGVIGDLVGFVAATYMRGISYTQIPTTLLAQVDSSVGGKTGIDLPEGKNLVGAFNPPNQVQIDTDLLSTLPQRQFACGMAEVIKYGLIQSPELNQNLEQNPLTPNDPRLAEVVRECIEIKARMVEEDEFERLGIRAQLNFGHTVGHVVEQMTNYQKYTHGEAIAVGMVVEAQIAEKLGLASPGLTERVESHMIRHGLPTRAPELSEVDTVLATIRKDKKSMQGEISMSLVESVGTCVFHTDIDEALVREAVKEYA